MCKDSRVPPNAGERVVCVCISAGNIIANKYLLPVAGSINIKEKLETQFAYNARGTFVFLLSLLSVTLKDCIEARYDSN